MFADVGYEEAETKGLGWISGKVSKIDNQNGKFKLPHIGWNEIEIQKESKIFKDIKNKSHMYFVHSYEFIPEDKSVISATTDYSSKIVCSVERDNLFGTQFHPEKSDKIGLKIIDNFYKTIMKIFPAIDIKDKKCVRLIKGDFENKTEYETLTIDQAGKYKDHGFKNLHIVDLDGALTGKTVNLDIIQEIVSKYDLKIEIGGGVRSLDSIKQYIDAGVEKVILGSGAIKNKEFLKEACEKFKSQIALGLDAKDGNLSVSGWKENLNIKTIDFLKEVNSYGVSRIIYTDINRDGMKTSPNLDETVKIAELSNCPVVISGGVSSINDIKKAKELNNKKIEGIIVGKAIYDGDIKLDELAKEISA